MLFWFLINLSSFILVCNMEICCKTTSNLGLNRNSAYSSTTKVLQEIGYQLLEIFQWHKKDWIISALHIFHNGSVHFFNFSILLCGISYTFTAQCTQFVFLLIMHISSKYEKYTFCHLSHLKCNIFCWKGAVAIELYSLKREKTSPIVLNHISHCKMCEIINIISVRRSFQ